MTHRLHGSQGFSAQCHTSCSTLALSARPLHRHFRGLTGSHSGKERTGMMLTPRARLGAAVLVLSSSAILGAGEAWAQVPPLSSLTVPRPSNLAAFIRDGQAAVVL